MSSVTQHELSDDEVGGGATSGIRGAKDESVLCYLCVRPGQMKYRYKGVMLHANCFSAVRCHNRLLATSPEKLEEANKEMLLNPAIWRETIMPLVENANQPRDKSYFNKLKRKYEEDLKESYKFEDVEEVEDLVDLDDYIERLRDQGSTLSDDELEDDFHMAMSNQQTQGKKYKTKAGVFMLAVGKAKVQLRSVTGAGDRKVTRTVNEEEASTESGGRARSVVASSSGRSSVRRSTIPSAQYIPRPVRTNSQPHTPSLSTIARTTASLAEAQEITNPPAQPQPTCHRRG